VAARAVATRRSGYEHEVVIDGRHRLVVDEPTDAGGTDAGPSPTRLLAGSLASCVAITVEMYADRKGWDVGELTVEVEMAYDGPAPSEFSVTLRLPEALDDEQRERLLTIAGKCPVHRALTAEPRVVIHDRVAPL
jgi:putative redox protein